MFYFRYLSGEIVLLLVIVLHSMSFFATRGLSIKTKQKT